MVPSHVMTCRTVRQTTRADAVWCRLLPGRTATSEQTWSNHGGGHVPKRQLRFVITPACVASNWTCPSAWDCAEDREGRQSLMPGRLCLGGLALRGFLYTQ